MLDPGVIEAEFDKSHWDGFEDEATLSRITCPTLLIYGDPEKGSVLTPGRVSRILSAIPDIVADHMEVGHMAREQSEQYARIVTGFLESL